MRLGAAWALSALLLGHAVTACAQPSNDTILEARDAWRTRNANRLSQLRAKAVSENHLLASWVDYWALNNRLNAATVDEVDAFYKRWPGTYVEDRLRNDWLLELGRRRDWPAITADYPRFRMNDDREVSCYAMVAALLAAPSTGRDVREQARTAWAAQREADDGCALLGSTLYDTKAITEADAWRRARVAMDGGRPKISALTAQLVNPRFGTEVTALSEKPERYLNRLTARTRPDKELATLALMRLASTDPDAAASALNSKWEAALPAELAAWAWAAVGKQAAMKLYPDASTYFQRAALLAGKAAVEIDWADDTLAWKARAALRANDGKPRWQHVNQSINAMNLAEQREPTWVYWKARALLALAKDSSEPEAMTAQGQEMLSGIAGQLHFYGMLAAEDLNQPILLPPLPAPPTDAERQAAAREPGIVRALQLIAIGLRSEGVREWNFTLRGMDDRALLAAAQIACDREIWDRCINSSDRTKNEINLAQRYPMPFKRELLARTREIGLDPAYVYGLIRQESRFVTDARSGVGASGLMQVMPATAKWTARKAGIPFAPDMLNDRDVNLKIGTQYLKLVLDDLEGSQAMAAAAYNAGPSRPRRWREGPVVEAAAWAENVPFTETRDYVKRVLANATLYAALLAQPLPAAVAAPSVAGASAPPQPAVRAPSLKARLGRFIGPRQGNSPPLDLDLP